MGQPKDNISAGLDALLGGSRPSESQTSPEPRRRGFNLGHGGQSAIKDRMATSLVVNRSKYAKIRQIAIDNSLNINEVIDVALDMVIEAYEKKYGPISASESRISASDIIRSRKSDSRRAKKPRERQVKNDVWLPGHKQDPAERRTSAKIVKSSERRKCI